MGELAKLCLWPCSFLLLQSDLLKAPLEEKLALSRNLIDVCGKTPELF